MRDVLFTFAMQYIYILMLAIQSLNINNGRRVGAMFTSLLLGVFGFHISAAIAANRGDEFGTVWLGYVLAGPCGALTGMEIFRRRRCE